jgi:hypothetical protein
MVIILDKPFDVGDLAPDQSWPCVYITKFGSYGPSATLAVTYEFGLMQDESMVKPGTWTPCPWNTATRIEFSGQRLAPFYMAKPDPHLDLWHQIEGIIYSQIQANDPRCAGSVGLSPYTASSPTPPSALNSGSSANSGADASNSTTPSQTPQDAPQSTQASDPSTGSNSDSSAATEQPPASES